MNAQALFAVAAGLNALSDAGLRVWLAIKDLPAEGTPEEVAKWQEVKARLALRMPQVRDLPILDVDAP